MSAYTDLPAWCIGTDGLDYRTTTPIRWSLGRKGSGFVYEVPAGFRFQVSIPAALRWAFDPHDRRFLKAAALHDHMLEAGWDRLTSGAVFHQALKADGVGRVRRIIMWLAVSLYKYD